MATGRKTGGRKPGSLNKPKVSTDVEAGGRISLGSSRAPVREAVSDPLFPRYRVVPTAHLVAYDRNPRTHSAAQVDKLVASIREFGFTNAILTDGKRGVVAGHGRLLAAVKLGMATVPTLELSHLSAAQRRAYVIADNKLALDAGWDDELLRLELGELQEGGFDLSLTGFDGSELDALFGDDVGAGAGSLAERFGVPPFSVLNAREGWWQDRKRAWLALGIQSELGRGASSGDKLSMSDTVQRLKPSADQASKRAGRVRAVAA